MLKSLTAILFALLLPPGGVPPPAPDAPAYTADGAMKLPANYREWVYLTSGLDMNYNTAAPVAGHSVFDNVFVNPSSYRTFLATGSWPDKTTFILEIRGADAHASIDRRGQSQNAEVHAIEVHVKDEARFAGKWAFFAFDGDKPAKAIPTSADCYSCHAQHAAVDTTFVQFYPTLLPVAKEKRTLSAPYLKEAATPPQ